MSWDGRKECESQSDSVAPSHPPDLTQCDWCSLTLGDLNAVTSKDGVSVSMCNVGNYVGIESLCHGPHQY